MNHRPHNGSEGTDQAMTDEPRAGQLSRRTFLKYAGGAILVAAAAGGAGPRALRGLAGPDTATAAGPLTLALAGTDGWIYLPGPPIPTFHPDPLAPQAVEGDPASQLTTFAFGFRNVTGLSETQKFGQKGKAQVSAPLLWVDEYDDNPANTLYIRLTNIGLAQRPDLFDAHTLHWHGFKNQIPYFDGEPSGSVSVPGGRTFEYAYRPRDPGTYMYHCHVEDTEHVQMGMTGMIFVRPKQNLKGNNYYPSDKYAYNDGDGSTGYDREYAMFMSEVFAEAHWNGAHIQETLWSEYRPDFALLNGRAYPDTLEPSTIVNPYPGAGYTPYEPGGDLPVPARPELRFQPLSSLVTCNAGERVLLRFANLGYTQQAMTLTGLRARIVGKDATLLRGRTGANGSYTTDSIPLGAGESVDAIFTAPPHSGGSGPDVYLLYNRAYRRSNNLAPGGFGGQTTEIRVYPGGALAAQEYPHQAKEPVA